MSLGCSGDARRSLAGKDSEAKAAAGRHNAEGSGRLLPRLQAGAPAVGLSERREVV